MLNLYEFNTLRACSEAGPRTQRAIADRAGVSLGSTNKALRKLTNLGLLDERCHVTAAGLKELEPHRVRNAIILAAGLGARLVPLSFELPKALIKVRGEILIERLIRQLHEAGINQIVVVVGHMKEALFYLEDEFNVNVVVSVEYLKRNNHSSLYAARSYLGSTYVCSCDQYYADGMFHTYEFQPFCTVQRSTDEACEQAVECQRNGRITSVGRGGAGSLYMHGPAYFTQDLAERYLDILQREYNDSATYGKLWEDVMAPHLDELPIYAREVGQSAVVDFNSFDDLREFDADFFENVDSAILDNICCTLDCARNDVTDVVPLTAGLSNLSVVFSCKGQRYVYRHPGAGTDEVVNRAAETWAQQVAERLGLDATFVHEDPDIGWKISRFIEGCEPFDYRNRAQVAQALSLIRKLHESGETSPWSFDYAQEANKIVELLRDMRYPMPADFPQLARTATALAAAMEGDQVAPALCHNDFYGPNILVKGQDMWLIDWEYSATGDPTCDVGNFVAQGSGYTVQEATDILDLYYGRKPTPQETRHCLAAIGLVGYYWYVWGVFKEAKGDPVGEWLYVWYKAAKRFMPVAMALYDTEEK